MATFSHGLFDYITFIILYIKRFIFLYDFVLFSFILFFNSAAVA